MIVWREGSESVPAGESYDIVAQTCIDNMRRLSAERLAKRYGARG